MRLYQQLETLLYNTRRYYKDVERDRGNKELESKGDIYVRCFKYKVELSNVHFAEHKLAIEDAKAMLENEGWIATK
ncbi:hypothetical protein [Lactobacillus amylovorus]|uniref:hypothetical protein n=1 Tax=Lactobacillus amylovorus TaxID=1604 RepID=UPI003F902409